VAAILPCSEVNGPGRRSVVWLQGCPLRCPGCRNPTLWPALRERLAPAPVLTAELVSTAGIEGVTFTGGEPFAQAAGLAPVARAVRRAGLSVMVWTGYDLDELGSPAARALLAQVDLLVTGRFLRDRARPGLAWRGSDNQRVWYRTARYGPADEPAGGEVEVHLGPGGAARLTGFPDDGLLDALRRHEGRP